MKKRWSILLIVSLVLGSIGIVYHETVTASPTTYLAKIAPGVSMQKGKTVSVMVEMNAASISAFDQQAKVKKYSLTLIHNYPKQLAQQQNTFIKDLKASITTAHIRRNYHMLFSGVALQLDGSEVAKLAQLPGVEHIYPIRQYHMLDVDSLPLTQAPAVWQEKDANGQNITGKGIKVGIIDTGVDSTRPDLAGKVVGGYDFVDHDTNPADENGHGTHVAGIIAANGTLKGVAPDASIYAYRVLDANGSGSSDNIMAALERAVTDHVDVVNMSLGDLNNDPDEPMALAVDNAVAQGVTVVIANGNSGPQRWTVGAPGTSRNAISVGASTKKIPLPVVQVVGDLKKMEGNIITFAPQFPLSGTYTLVDYGSERPQDLIKNVTGKIVLIKRTSDSAQQEAAIAKKHGAVAALIYNNQSGEWYSQLPNNPSSMAPTALLSGAYGNYLKMKLATGHNRIQLSSVSRERIIDFSSRGPVNTTWAIKPDVVAPGVDILSTVPTFVNSSGYERESGTSMATPHVTGAVALIKQAHPDWTPLEIKAALSNNATFLLDSEHKRAPLLEQGSGRIDVLKAIHAQTLVIPNNFSFGMFNSNTGIKTVTKSVVMENKSASVKNYTIHVQLDTSNSNFTVTVPSTLQVQPNSSGTFNAQLTLNTILPRGYYTGVLYVSDGTQQEKVPFIVMIDPVDAS